MHISLKFRKSPDKNAVKIILHYKRIQPQKSSYLSLFIGARIATLVIEVGGVWLAVSVIGQDKMIGKLETQVLVVIGNYFISKFLVFTGNKEDKE